MGLVGFARPRASLSARKHTGLSCGGGREIEKRRYWDEHTGARARRRQRTLKEAEARAAARPGKPRQLTLVEVGQVRKSAGPIISADTVTPGCETDGTMLHGHAQGTVAQVSAACHGFSTNKK